ncbi:hypothetical protein [endosymbiont of Riftia pachyptila]|uniref:Uncharacterized protein n=1 Tax=endosymbiont of Riftia pachyptila (vent Ph05) TaxID=1048808 RepID=G2DF69_9GAMM|nr:hypothetical protein [endosymbiont of Riftia pachyptila]EGV50720.1 hypothetical protein Rifp1Sym_cm00020 [endosymbiont of Riftia pachyptila (vent Ph05)]
MREIDAVSEALSNHADNTYEMANQLLVLADLIEDEKHQVQHWYSGSETTVLERLGKASTGYITFWQATSRDAAGRLSSSCTGRWPDHHP